MHAVDFFEMALPVIGAIQLFVAAVSPLWAIIEWEVDKTLPRQTLVVALSTWLAVGFFCMAKEPMVALISLIPPTLDPRLIFAICVDCLALLLWIVFYNLVSSIWPQQPQPEAPQQEPITATPVSAPPTALAMVVRSDQHMVVPPPPVIQSAMDHAPAIRNPLSAFANSIGTNAQISALENAARLADATARTAEAEAKGFEAVMRREDSLIEMRVRQQINPELEQNKIETQRERLREDAHRRTISTERRSKEHWDARRDTIHARNGEEAARKFKKRKFELGDRRARARMADVDVDTATANAASRKLGADPEGDAAADTMMDLQMLADTIRQRLLLASAEGEDTTWLSDHLAHIEAVLRK